MQTVAEMIPDYKQNLDALRARRRELIAERELEPRFERRHALTVRIIRLDGIIASTTAALHGAREVRILRQAQAARR